MFTHGSQAIRKWYAEMPDKLGQILASRTAEGLPVKSTEEREALERQREKEFLATQGDYTSEVRKMACTRTMCQSLSAAPASWHTVESRSIVRGAACNVALRWLRRSSMSW